MNYYQNEEFNSKINSNQSLPNLSKSNRSHKKDSNNKPNYNIPLPKPFERKISEENERENSEENINDKEKINFKDLENKENENPEKAKKSKKSNNPLSPSRPNNNNLNNLKNEEFTISISPEPRRKINQYPININTNPENSSLEKNENKENNINNINISGLKINGFKSNMENPLNPEDEKNFLEKLDYSIKHLFIAKAYEQLENTDLALKNYMTALRFDPGNKEAFDAMKILDLYSEKRSDFFDELNFDPINNWLVDYYDCILTDNLVFSKNSDCVTSLADSAIVRNFQEEPICKKISQNFFLNLISIILINYHL